MYFEFIYKLGKRFRFLPKVKQIDDKLRVVEFPYNSAELLSGIFLFFVAFLFVSVLSYLLLPFFGLIVLFFTLVVSFAAYVYAMAVYYSARMIDYREEMLRAVLRISTYIAENASFEYAVIQAAKTARGTLRKQLNDIKKKLESKEKTTLGQAFEDYIEMWNSVNPDFVKSLRLLQTASISLKEDRQSIIDEVLETIIVSYHNSGKRFAEELSHKTKALIAVGVLLPMMSLMLLPLVSIFMPQLASAGILAFVYNILFPTALLLMAMQFASKRIQVTTIRLEESPGFKATPLVDFVLPLAIVVMFALPAVVHFSTLDLSAAEAITREYAFTSIVIIWISLLGAVIAAAYFCKRYIKRNEKLWHEINEIEQDLPHLLQTFSSYLSLNRSIESILADVEEDYKAHGFKEHAVVKIFGNIRNSLMKTKQKLEDLVKDALPKICPSKRFNELLEQIISFSDVGQKSAARAAKMIRQQTVSIYKLDDYLRTLLSETTGLISITATMLAPLLATAAIVMSMGIVMSLEFITKQLNVIQGSLGVGGTEIDLQLVDVTQIVPPTIVESIVGVYFFEMIIILSVFLANVKIGNDKYKMADTVYNNLVLSFMIYSLLLFGGYFIFREVVFAGMLRG